MKKNIVIFGIAAVLFALLGVFFGYRQTNSNKVEASAVEHLLSQSMPDISGKPQHLDQWKGQALIVNFWATWCTPCVDEMPELSALQSEIEPQKIQILGIGIDSATNIAEFASKYHIRYPLFVAGVSGTELSRQFGNQAGGLPYTVLIGRDGQVKKTYLGRLKMNELKKELASL
ncbi:TlpA disulfide reductase family protein [Noviherbaspirillum sp.]|uniref:TlpA disulfide reductase family protein n=1 Tax=Noviherbaspirillum sp. TaxID=1926288 RepID=UPI002B4A298D|nr:TlpA disulfide reductase family protein [Noviherbaspirillum sp.]HJV83617.1 TlpA disulfide reductase family protein [Noviherbaspirillum sp.]